MSNLSSLRDRITALLKENSSTAYNRSEIARALRIPLKERLLLRRTVKAMEREGELLSEPRSRYVLPRPPASKKSSRKPRKGRNKKASSSAKASASSKSSSSPPAELLTGRLRLLGNGHGTIRLEMPHASGQRSVYLPPGNSATALSGDLVEVQLVERKEPKWAKHSPKGRKRYQKQAEQYKDELVGTVVNLLERADHQLVGTLFKRSGRYYIEPDSPSLPPLIEVSKRGEAEPGQKVVLSLEKWTTPHLPPLGSVSNILGWHDEPGIDILGIIHRYNLELEFPPEVQAEADRIPETLPEAEIARRFDCRDYPIVTIDPHDARDHDDAIWVEELTAADGGGWKLHVHIADVSHYVKPGQNLDQEALKRGNSTYMVDRVIPMLPTALSNGLCSLVPDEDRLTKCAVVTFAPDGKIRKTSFHSAVIRSKARLSYEEAQKMLDDPKLEHPFAPQVRTAWALAQILRKKRFENGALDLEFPEYRITLSEKGETTGYKLVEHTESHQLVEEFMLIANESVALALKNAKKPTLYRTHEDPDYDKLDEFGEQARILGCQSGDLSSKKELQKVIRQLSGTAVEQTLKLALLKSLKRASYTNEPLGHYGLAKVNYTHFTSPIRRYADLVVHRTLQPLLDNPPAQPDPAPKLAQCAEIADHLSKTERISADAEMESKKYKLLQWLSTITTTVQGEKAPTFEALVTDVRPMGLFVELKETMLRGMVRSKDFPPGHWNFDNGTKRYHSSRKRSVGLADRITVQVKQVDFDRQRVDFILAGDDF